MKEEANPTPPLQKEAYACSGAWASVGTLQKGT